MTQDQPPTIPYCGTAPLPRELWLHWNLDPALLGALALIAFAYELGVRRMLRSNPQGAPATLAAARAFYLGWFLVAVALVSPLCNLSVALFSARVSQHMLLLLIAAPLVVMGRPGRMLAAVTGGVPRWLRVLARPATSVPFAWLAFATSLWFWHAPVAYGLTFESATAWWIMHLTLFGSAVLLWRILLPRASDENVVARILAGFTTLLHMGVLGALITFAPSVLYWPHVFTTQAWGLTPLEDQQLGGLIMWVPGASGFLAAALASAALALRPRASS